VSCKFNEYIKETAVKVAINPADIRFSLILLCLVYFSKLKARFRPESKQRMSNVLALSCD
jgi:hypothetical protein